MAGLGSGAVLDTQADLVGMLPGPPVGPADQPVEGMVVRAHGLQDRDGHSSGPIVTAPGYSATWSSHWTQKTELSGRHTRPVTVREVIRS